MHRSSNPATLLLLLILLLVLQLLCSALCVGPKQCLDVGLCKKDRV